MIHVDPAPAQPLRERLVGSWNLDAPLVCCTIQMVRHRAAWSRRRRIVNSARRNRTRIVSSYCLIRRSVAMCHHRALGPRESDGRLMARSDLLINLVKAGALGDQSLFRKTVEAVIAEERGKNHTVLADR